MRTSTRAKALAHTAIARRPTAAPPAAGWATTGPGAPPAPLARRRRTALAPATARRTPATATAALASRTGRGKRAVVRATALIQASRKRVGRCRNAATWPPRIPAGRPAAMPQTMTGPAAGTARRLAGNEASGMPPKTGSSTGATPAWAARVTASGAGTPLTASGRESKAMPAHAETESRKPIEPARSGSTSTSPVPASDSTRIDDAGRPRVAAPNASPAMATARRTDGSHRVSTPNVARTNTPVTSRPRIESRRNSGPAMARTKATFWPETASRCVRPAARKSSTSVGSCSRSSPRTRPVNSALRSGGSDAAPATSVRRSWLAKRVTGPPASGSRAAETTSALPMCRRARKARLEALTGRRRPSTMTDSPASIGANTAAASAAAVADSRRPSGNRNSVRSDPKRHSGSRTSVAR